MIEKAWNAALFALALGALLFIFGPGLVGAVDLGCWFMTSTQCTGVDWTEGRKMWGALAWGLLVFILICGEV